MPKHSVPFPWPFPFPMWCPMLMPICSLQMSILHAQYINPFSILFADAETFGAVPVPEAEA
jgi:hypothetical protein